MMSMATDKLCGSTHSLFLQTFFLFFFFTSPSLAFPHLYLDRYIDTEDA